MFEATFESLSSHKCPDWFRDVKQYSGILVVDLPDKMPTEYPNALEITLE